MSPTWRKAPQSDDYGNCIELAALAGAVAIRDSKAPDVGHLILTPRAFVRLLAHVRQGSVSR
ncbi:DUF397 domain-containing protein [Actinomadura sp. GC306]|uniref:DUF397 domain-containing protein n=1 Tax=Actinomadura sp. GC306 TaxID=2530367 RepID=UPI00104EC02C|nr:DUF397 domain-containing protein [Actinomadura sp. GC306]TDC67841.1 DUF397 domain-containing protein [Actinomadura sp. GC306]